MTHILKRREVWYWVNYVFNRVDPSRVAGVGPDRAAAEWILRLGGRVQFKDYDHWSSDYNRLPSGGKGSLKLVVINGSGLAITSNGLEHLHGLEYLERLNLSRCNYLYDDGLGYLMFVEKSLKALDLSYCLSLTEKALVNHLCQLKCLEKLHLKGLTISENSLLKLSNSLPRCDISTDQSNKT